MLPSNVMLWISGQVTVRITRHIVIYAWYCYLYVYLNAETASSAALASVVSSTSITEAEVTLSPNIVLITVIPLTTVLLFSAAVICTVVLCYARHKQQQHKEERQEKSELMNYHLKL